MFLLYSLISIIDELHQRDIVIGNALKDSIYVEEKRVIIEPDQVSTKEKDIEKLVYFIKDILKVLRDEGKR